MASATSHLLSLMPATPPRRNAVKHDLAGYGTVLATCKFMAWAHEQEHFPSPEAVMTRFNVCRATAYRWTRALAETYGLDPATRHGGRPSR
jgi:hypothetical protein